MSNDNYNSEIYELLSAYMDNELSESQLERVSQLLQEDPRVQEIYSGLQRSSQLISSLPREGVPRDLTEEVLYALERDTLLDGNDDMAIVAGERHLRIRNFLGVAAILLLVGAVFVVVYNVLVPPEIVSVPSTTFHEEHPENNFVANNTTSQEPLNNDQGVPTFKTLREAARLLGTKPEDGQTGPDIESSSMQVSTEAAVKPEEFVQSEPLPKLPEIKPFEAPNPNWRSLSLKSQIDSDDTIAVERVSNMLAGLGIDYLVSDNVSGLKVFAFVCESDRFGDFYRSLRETLPGEIDLELEDVGIYQKVEVLSVSADEVIPLAVSSDQDKQLSYLQSRLDEDRLRFVLKAKEPVFPLWRQMANIVPQQYQDAFGKSLENIVGPIDFDSKEQESIIARYQRYENEKAADEGGSIIALGNIRAVSESPVNSAIANEVEASPAQSDSMLLSTDVQSSSVELEGGRLVANVIESDSGVSARTFSAGLPKMAKTSKAVSSNADDVSKPEQHQEVKVGVDYIAVEIVLTVETPSTPQEQGPDPGPIMNILPFTPETRINFGYSPR